MERKYYNGRVVLSDSMGGDLAVVNAARVSYGKRSVTLDDGDKKLIRYLAQHKHMSPFRHVQLSLVLERIPEFILRQLFKHQVGMGYTAGEFREAATVWNELSGRYVEFDMNFFEVDEFRKQHKVNKQASDPNNLVDDQDTAREIYDQAIQQSFAAYNKLLEMGVAKEQARLVIPLAFETSVIWTGSLEAFVNFVRLRDHDGAQYEIQLLARIVREILMEVAPFSTEALLGE